MAISRSLDADLARAGYHPAPVRAVIDVALAGERVISWLVHPETTFDDTHVRRHLTAVVLTATRLITAHVDDDTEGPAPTGLLATTEAVPLDRVRAVGLTHGLAVGDAGHDMRATELTVAVSWGAVDRLDLEPARCADPSCEADHGYTGTRAPEDLVVRISALAEGEDALAAALEFGTALSRATAR